MNLSFTLYEILGYALPGAVSLVALIVTVWASSYPSTPLPIGALSPQAIACASLVSYLLGHTIQALGNLVTDNVKVRTAVYGTDGLAGFPASVIPTLNTRLQMVMLGRNDQIKLSTHQVYELCEEALVQAGETKDRDVYQYREGFYRGVAISGSMLLFSLILRFLRGRPSILVRTNLYLIPPSVLFLLALALFLAIVFAWMRYRRFARYRVRRAMMGFLALKRGDSCG